MNKPRRMGCPSGGRVHFTQKCIDGLPKNATITELCDALHIVRITVHQWIQRKTSPLKFSIVKVKKGSLTVPIKHFMKEDVVRFLIDTKRFKPKPEYAE